MRLGVVVLFLCLAPGAALAQEPGQDVEGCKDSKLMNRMPGCGIMECNVKEFDSAELRIKPWSESGPGQTKTLEGQVEIVRYICPAKLSLLQIARNGEAAMRKAGFAIDFSGKTEDNNPMVTGHKGPQWMEIKTEAWNEYTTYWQSAVKVQQMAQELETNAGALADEINKSGRVAVYGINFDTGKSTLKPESDKVLGEIAILLKNNAGWKLRLEGHTDNVGGKAANQALSEQRAAAVVAWLVKNGIGKDRLAAQGFGDSKPVADNSSEEGRAKNRRVELVKV